MKACITTNVSLPLSLQATELLKQYLDEIIADPYGSVGEIKIVVSPKGVQITKTKQRYFPWNA